MIRKESAHETAIRRPPPTHLVRRRPPRRVTTPDRQAVPRQRPTITRLLQLRRQTGSTAPSPHGGGKDPVLDHAGLERLRQFVADVPDATLLPLRERLGLAGRIMIVWRGLQKLGITRKKKTQHATEADRAEVHRERRSFRREVVVFDNLGAHPGAAVVAAIERPGVTVLRLPRYSPIEGMFSKFKEGLRRLGARTRDQLDEALGKALRRVTTQDIRGWFRNAGLRAKPA